MPLEIAEEMFARQPAEAQGIIRLLQAHIAQQDRRIAELEARLKELESRLKLSPRNSSLPPSSEHPLAKPLSQKKARSKKKRGGQPGHIKHERPLIPVEQCSRVIVLKPSALRHDAQR